MLRLKNKPPIAARQVTTDKTPAGFALFGVGIAFSGPFEFKRTFKLRDMQVDGMLEL